jgi:hypothetical protein
MIIRLSVNDNDFTQQIEPYVKNFVCYIRELMPEQDLGENPTFEEVYNWRQRDKEINRLMNPNSSVVLTDKDKRVIVSQIKRTFGVYCDNHFDKDTANYLKKGLNVKVLTRIEDKWENGEAIYWFQHADKYIIL